MPRRRNCHRMRSANGRIIYGTGSANRWFVLLAATAFISPDCPQRTKKIVGGFSVPKSATVRSGLARGPFPLPPRCAVDTDMSEAVATQLPKRREIFGEEETGLAVRNVPARVAIEARPGVKNARSSNTIIVAAIGGEKEAVEEGEADSIDAATTAEGAADDGGGDGADEALSAENDDESRVKRSAAAALLRRSGAGRRQRPASGTVVGRTKTSVGGIRKGSASRARSGRTATGSILGTVRASAVAAAAAAEKQQEKDAVAEGAAEIEANSTSTNVTGSSPSTGGGGGNQSSADGSSAVLPKTVIQSTINDLLSQQGESWDDNKGGISASYLERRGSMGLLGEPVRGPPPCPPSAQFRTPYPGSVLVHPTYVENGENVGAGQIRDQIAVRVATQSDDADIALLRLSVFSDFTPDLRRKFCQRSCEVLSHRRTRGATCLVATVDQSMREDILNRNGALGDVKYSAPPIYAGNKAGPRKDWIIGSVECSVHEFHGTILGRCRPSGGLLYITEVAVSPETRRCGAGYLLMKGVDELAVVRDVETLYLHVDVTNSFARSLYEKAGFQYADKRDPMYREFTKLLNLHDGATKGRNHYLLYKHITDSPTWIDTEFRHDGNRASAGAVLGFEVPPGT